LLAVYYSCKIWQKNSFFILFISYRTGHTVSSCQNVDSSDFIISFTFRSLSLSANTDMATRSKISITTNITTTMISLFSSFVVGLHWQYCSRTTLRNTERNKIKWNATTYLLLRNAFSDILLFSGNNVTDHRSL
jgi:hypothetical protein